MLTEAEVAPEEMPHQQDDGPSNLNSFSTVATGLHGYEAALLMKSIRLHSDKKIYLMADNEAFNLLCDDMPKNVNTTIISEKEKLEREAEYKASPDTIWPSCPKFPNLWNPASQSYKMDVMSKAIKSSGNTLFLDADVILVNPVDCKFSSSVALSKHNGVCGGGYVYANDPSFPDSWKELYNRELRAKTDGGVVHSCGKCGDIPTVKLKGNHKPSLFGATHNLGPWRSPRPFAGAEVGEIMESLGLSVDDDIYIDDGDGPEKVVSFHVHLRPKDEQADESYNLVRSFYECLLRSAKSTHKQLMDFICNVYLPNAFRLKLGEANTLRV